MKPITFACTLLLVNVLLPLPSTAQTVYTALQIPAYCQQTPFSVKMFPERKIYAFSQIQQMMLTFNLDGSLASQINVLDNRPQDIQYHFMDFQVDDKGKIYILAIWRDAPRQTHCGVFVYNADNTFDKLIELKKYVDARKILIDGQKNIIIVGLSPDFYFGKTSHVYLMHRYNQLGDFLNSGFEVDPRNYVPPTSVNVSSLYGTLRPLVDHLPSGFHVHRGIYAVVPGTHDIEFLEPRTFAPSRTVHLQTPNIMPPAQPESLKSAVMAGTELQISGVHVTENTITVYFDRETRYQGPSARVHQTVRAVYLFDSPAPQSVSQITTVDRQLIEDAGVSSEQDYTFSYSDDTIRLRR